MKPTIIIALLFGMLCSCKMNTASTTPQKISSLATPMLEKFNAQEQRFELSGCINRYNGNEFSLDFPINKIIESLGPPEESRHNKRKETISYKWLNGVVTLYQNSQSSMAYGLFIDLENVEDTDPPLYFLVDGIPIEKDMTMGEFASLSSLGFSKFQIGRSDYELTFNNCDRAITYRFHSQINHQYHGGGHLQMRGDADLTVTHPVKYIYIEYTSL